MIVLLLWSISWIIMLIIRYVLWWGCFIIITIIGLIKFKYYNNPAYTIILYFFVQEIGGVVFILSYSTIRQMIIIILKGGFSPFHFWLVPVISIRKGQAFLWILTWQKMPYVFIIINFLSWSLIIIILLRIVFPLVQGIFVRRFKIVLFYLISSSGRRALIYGYYSPLSIILTIPLYMHLMYRIMGMVGTFGNIYLGLESVFVLIRIPGRLPFYFKIGIMGCLVEGGGLMLLVVLVIFVLNITITINVIVNFNYKFSPANKHFIFLFIRYIVGPYF